MRHLQTFKMFESTSNLTKEQLQFLDKCTKGSWSQDPSTGEINVEGDFVIPKNYTRDFKGLQFGKVSRNFYCYSISLTSLVGAPTTVEGDFWCSDNRLTSLKGGPTTVEGGFYCSANRLTSLEGGPTTVGGNFNCSDNRLTSLEGAPETVGGDFYCYNNSLQTLEGSPKTVGGNFDCSDNDLQTLEGAPETVGGEFYSDEMEIPEGEWSQETLVEIFTTGTSKQKQMVAPILDPKVLQQKIDQDPEKMLVKLKGLLKDPHFKDLNWPKHLDQEKELLSDLSDIGL